MPDAGRNSLFEFSSKRILPVSAEVTFTPTNAWASDGRRKTSRIRVCNSARLRVVVAVVLAIAGVGETEGAGNAAGDATGVGVGDASTRRSRCGCCWALEKGMGN
jgi:hypothetical protein